MLCIRSVLCKSQETQLVLAVRFMGTEGGTKLSAVWSERCFKAPLRPDSCTLDQTVGEALRSTSLTIQLHIDQFRLLERCFEATLRPDSYTSDQTDGEVLRSTTQSDQTAAH